MAKKVVTLVLFFNETGGWETEKYTLYQVKDEGLKPGESAEEIAAEEKPKKIKTRSENTVNTTEWSQEQQRALEAALTKYPKGASVDRWEKISNCVEGKTKVQLLKSIHYIKSLIK